MLNLDQEVFLKGTIVGMEKDREGRRYDHPERITVYESDLRSRLCDFVNE